MAFVDEIKIHAEAGRGGDGVVRWRQEKFIPKGGPAGGDAGRGGDFYVIGVRDVGILAQYKAKHEFIAGRGEDGGNKSLHGANGEDYVLELPLGSVITNLATDEKWYLNEVGQKILLLKGGYGGYGNEHFKSSVNTTPQERNVGEEGERADFLIELELFADVGLVGLPNAGKSSLLNALTNAEAKVGDYAFTTLDPNLGAFYGFIIADIPGIIEGASEGKGLGVKFLKHIKRTKMLAHLISLDSEREPSASDGAGNKNPMERYLEVRKELEKYGNDLDKKEEIIVLTKSDLMEDKKVLMKVVKDFKKISENVFVLSLFDDESVKAFHDELVKILRKI
ncbi:hypothetical protein A2914_01645 [Candidatus Nomurabacteria bacterium RIFCSPLOWO2_01_FULL_41_21]|uniref:GTPase Obg n=2 Tax=Candidatus Nomuraibacteriota TaxID=1752729 RepID=A0A1F6V204_9BACT|nr:MAG: hypothetical protein A2733_00555 [Candidatus Nomurabacteria bacterium RIFCSPHIGHO2_01_FULL_40_20]OGI88023.1 MAG: hypothetical protein A2914_01645 [Candidatus Nomurabacteria bacterium RIFCSPLOWO2_01_FULL_41_21]